MITRRTRIQLLVFALITLVGVTYVGARYARLDRVIIDRSYTVVAHFPESGGIFAGGEVTYRGVRIGKVSELELTEDRSGVDVLLEIDNEWDEIPADTLAVVGNRSAVGEQYVELQPQTDDGPFLEDGSEIAEPLTTTPIATETLLGHLSDTVASVDRDALQTTVEELGIAFGDTGDDLQQIIDTGNSFIQTADENFEVTKALIEDSNIVLRGQIASKSSLKMFATHLSSFTTALAGADPALRRVIDSGSFAANQLRTFLEQNDVEISELLNNVTTTGEVVVRNLDGVETLFVAYPVLLEGSYAVMDKSPGSGMVDAHIGLILTTTPPCKGGYEGTTRRSPSNGEYWKMEMDARCTEPPTKSNPRGYQNLGPTPRPAPWQQVIVGYDRETGRVDWDVDENEFANAGSVAPASLGEDSWKWLYLQPLLAGQE